MSSRMWTWATAAMLTVGTYTAISHMVKDNYDVIDSQFRYGDTTKDVYELTLANGVEKDFTLKKNNLLYETITQSLERGNASVHARNTLPLQRPIIEYVQPKQLALDYQ